jgi:hypothetical protein
MAIRRRKVWIVVFVGLLVGVGVWFYFTPSDGGSDEARYQSRSRNQDVSLRLRAWERRWPKPLGSLLRRTGLTQRYEEKAEEQEEALLGSGYLVRVSIATTNFSLTNISLFGARLQKALPKDARGTYFWLETNRIVITCRTQDVQVCREALGEF